MNCHCSVELMNPSTVGPEDVLTICTKRVGEAEGMKLASPAYWAVIWCFPSDLYLTAQVAVSWVSGRRRQPGIGRPLSRNCIEPLGLIGPELLTGRTSVAV